MIRLLTIAACALLGGGSGVAYDAAKCTELLTGTWKLTYEGRSLTMDLSPASHLTMTTVPAGEDAYSQTGKWRTEAGERSDQCKLVATGEGQALNFQSIVTIIDDKRLELGILAEFGAFMRQ